MSKHLRILTEYELVKHKQEGREIYYSLEVEKMEEIDNGTGNSESGKPDSINSTMY